MERKITKYKYPYGITDFVANTREYGLKEAWEHDKIRTKEDLADRTSRMGEEVMFGLVLTVAGLVATVAIPYGIYKAVKNSNKK